MFPVMSAGNPITGYNINNSLRFRSSASATLSRTTGTSTSATTWTWSSWVKRGSLSSVQALLCGGSGGGTNSMIFFDSSDVFGVQFSGGTGGSITTTAVYRDPSAWYHLVIKVASTTATVYVNGVQMATGSVTPSYINANSTGHYIGWQNYSGSTRYFDGYMAEQYFIDGQALTPSSFGATDAVTGQWLPKQYSGTYGTNGFYLPFSNIATTSGSNTGLGKDFSGNGNYWNTNNISVTAGTTYDAMTDSPTLTSATAANYAVLNPLWKSSNLTLAGANLNVTSSGNGGTALSTMAMPSGKWYCEVTINTGSDATIVGICNDSFNPTTTTLTSANAVGYYGASGDKFVNGTQTAYGATYTTGNIIGIALDVDAGTVTFYKNNTSQGVITHGLTGLFYYATSDASSTSNIDQSWNFGQRPFTYTPPTGYLALNTYNLPTPTIKAGNKYMDATTYSGNSSTQTITNAGAFKPDLVWLKCRSTLGTWNNLVDSIRGTSKTLYSNTTNAEGTDNYLSAFNSNGFGLNTGDSGSNTSGNTYVAWQWQAGQGSTSSNTSGSITSTVSVNASAGFSIVTYTGTGANATVGHGLGVAPKLIITFCRGAAGRNHLTYHASLGNTQCVLLDATNAALTSSGYWNSTSPTSSVFSLGTSGDANGSGVTFVAYCWAEIAGFSKFGSYTGNGSADGSFVYTGFRPKYVMIKGNAVVNWWILDTSRNTYNVANEGLLANSSAATNATINPVDFVSNGFKLRDSNGEINANGTTYVYACFAENPMKYSNAR